jgi:ketosteroid isomerase-like protein
MVRGRSAIKSFWEKASETVGNMKLVTVDVKPSGADAAREVGTFSLRTKGSPPQEMTGKYVVIWQKAGSGWKLMTDIWNADK